MLVAESSLAGQVRLRYVLMAEWRTKEQKRGEKKTAELVVVVAVVVVRTYSHGSPCLRNAEFSPMILHLSLFQADTFYQVIHFRQAGHRPRAAIRVLRSDIQ